MPTYKLNITSQQRQSGTALITALMILTAMTVLGFSSLSNTNVQSAISRNTQFLMYARNAAGNEINGQLGLINNNASTEPDTIVQSLLDAGVGVEFPVALTTAQTAYTQQIQISLDCDPCPKDLGGFSFDSGGIAQLRATLVSSAELTNTAASSSQTQGFLYLIPSN